MKYREGELVKVKEDLIIGKSYSGSTFVKEMDVKFIKIEKVEQDKKRYRTKSYCYTEEMLEGLYISPHRKLVEEISKTYIEKNTKYGNSFGDTFDKVGIISAYTRISDKFNRFEYMVMNEDNGTDDERMRDTLLDMANYCLMTVIELEKENE